jgi:hypothetical protein
MYLVQEPTKASEKNIVLLVWIFVFCFSKVCNNTKEHYSSLCHVVGKPDFLGQPPPKVQEDPETLKRIQAILDDYNDQIRHGAMYFFPILALSSRSSLVFPVQGSDVSVFFFARVSDSRTFYANSKLF